jgi:hypothetical protein
MRTADINYVQIMRTILNMRYDLRKCEGKTLWTKNNVDRREICGAKLICERKS